MRTLKLLRGVCHGLMLAMVIGSPQAYSQVLLQDGLGAASSTNWTVVQNTTDSTATFGFDYSTVGIPPAPRGGDTIGLKTTVNDDATASVEHIAAVYSGAGSNFNGQYTVQVDIWNNYVLLPTPAPLVGSTEYQGVSVHHDAFEATPYGGTMMFDGDGGSGLDYRLYRNLSQHFAESGQFATPPPFTSAAGGDQDNVDDYYEAAFPTFDIDSAVNNQQGTTGVQVPAGAAGFQWMTLRVEVDPLALGNKVVVGSPEVFGLVRFYLKSARSGEEILIATINNNNGNANVVDFSAGSVGLMTSDLFSSTVADPTYSFTLFDNVTVTQGFLAPPAEDDADFDADGDVDGADFLAWQRGLGADGDLADGDANGDDIVDAADLAIWKEQFTAGAATPAVGAVPEPATWALAALACAACLVLAAPRRRVALAQVKVDGKSV